MSPSRDTKSRCFQDEFEVWKRRRKDDDDDDDCPSSTDISELFFQLANESTIRYRLLHDKKKIEIIIRQDLSATEHTGGIVWETSYLLASYMLNAFPNKKRQFGHLVEVGSGCGLLGLALHKSKQTKSTLLTETNSVMENLRYNVEQNRGSSQDDDSDTRSKKKRNRTLAAVPLDWTCYQEDCNAAGIVPHSIDTIVGTDVVFHVRFVKPLLETLRYLSHKETRIFLCLQERCADAHALLLSSANEFGLNISNITEVVTKTPNCEWGQELDCQILQFHVRVDETTSISKNRNEDGKKKRKR